MRHRFPILLGVALATAASALPMSGQEKPRLAIIAFENRSQWWAQDLGDLAADQLTTRLVNSGAFTVIERERLDDLLEEQGFQVSGQVDPSQAAEIGRIAGVDYLVTGSITSFSIDQTSTRVLGRTVGYTEAEAELNVRAFSATTAEITVAIEGSGKKRMVGVSGVINMSSRFDGGLAEQALSPAVDDVAEKLVGRQESFEVTAVVEESAPPAIVGGGADGSIYIDQGENLGIEVGQRFEVHRVVDEILDASGNVLDVLTDRVGILEVTRVLSQSAVCTVVEGEAAEGDELRPAGG